ncbi:hypothetical protein HanIR_Chr04g0173961 [Helianthus annuus]|nr:hypothetical protein HanIR_Chr04g0173961 [Helianthus annuus]
MLSVLPVLRSNHYLEIMCIPPSLCSLSISIEAEYPHDNYETSI